MNITEAGPGPKSESGAVLILVLIFALLLNIVASSVIQSAALQTRIAGNSHSYVEALHLAQSLGRSLVQDPNNFSLTQKVDTFNCLSFDQAANCQDNSLRMSASLPGFDHYEYRAAITRKAPETLFGEVVEIDPDGNVARVQFDVALFEIEVNVGGSGSSNKDVRINTGVAIPLDGSGHWISYQREPGVDAL
jgi:hypothetical protein